MKFIKSKEFKESKEQFDSIRQKAIRTIDSAIENVLQGKKNLDKEILLGESSGLCSGTCEVFLTNGNLTGKWRGSDKGERHIFIGEFIGYCVDTDNKIIAVLKILEENNLI